MPPIRCARTCTTFENASQVNNAGWLPLTQVVHRTGRQPIEFNESNNDDNHEGQPLKVPDIPLDEQHRLATLRSLGVLDTPHEDRFDRLTRLAKRVFRVPIALVSLVDENRQWFKSCDGFSVSETPRDVSFCGHAILGEDIFLIPDALTDARFSDNPMVVNEPHVRFYAGCPLRASNGSKIGTLCVIDHAPRDFDEDDAKALKDLAAMVEDELTAFQLSITDELTKISNRRGFLHLAQYSLSLCSRQGTAAALAFLDLDKFKPINDTFGHAEGDRALVVFAELMRASFRTSDLIARLGGDEFVVLLTNASQQQAENVIDAFAKRLQERNAADQRGYELAFSCGIVEFDIESHCSIDTLLAKGDALMYNIKVAKK
jgi:diguanylate cyclase (GGDEF)-like protein